MAALRTMPSLRAVMEIFVTFNECWLPALPC